MEKETSKPEACTQADKFRTKFEMEFWCSPGQTVSKTG